ncbi:MAG TPA: hypothetical protein VHI13_16685 [Candidatus Kapabacteria bacterium]|nr:hypothetical protein [Candidatus Kapabacteria bacterium]
MSTLGITKGGKFETPAAVDVHDELNVSEKLYTLLSEKDRAYIQREGNDVSVLASLETQLESEIKALLGEVAEDPRMKEIREKKAQLRQARTLRESKTTKVLGVVESALQGTKKGMSLAGKMHELITLPAPKTLKAGNS